MEDKENILIEDQAIFTKKLKEEITNSRDYADNVRWERVVESKNLMIYDENISGTCWTL